MLVELQEGQYIKNRAALSHNSIKAEGGGNLNYPFLTNSDFNFIAPKPSILQSIS